MESDMPDLIEICSSTASDNNNISVMEVSPSTFTNENYTKLCSALGNATADSSDNDEDYEDYDIEIEDTEALELCNSFNNTSSGQIHFETAQCLICKEKLQSPEAVLQHMQQLHLFDVVGICRINNLDQICYIKLINYIRTHTERAIKELTENSIDISKLEDSYMAPVNENDALLTFDIEMLLEEEEEVNGEKKLSALEVSEKEAQQLREEVSMLRDRMAVQQNMLERLLLQDTKVKEGKPESELAEHDAGYFDSYSTLGIHHEMINDKVRTEAYRDAILKNPGTFSGSLVLDVGCGTGILSMFCASAGAKHVTAVDMAEIAYDAMTAVSVNKLSNQVKVIRGKLEQQQINHKFDVIVSEWMGYFLLFEGMLDSVIEARDRFLKPGGVMMPNKCAMFVAGIDDAEMHHKYYSSWSDVYGFNMGQFKDDFIKDAFIQVVEEKHVATDSFQIKELDINTCKALDTQFTSVFELVPSRTTSISAIVGYFDTTFEMPEHTVYFSTGPHVKSTHWQQTVFLLKTPVRVVKGEPLCGSLTVGRTTENLRCLEVTIDIHGTEGKMLYNVR